MNQEVENTKRTLERLQKSNPEKSPGGINMDYGEWRTELGLDKPNSNPKNPRVEISKKAFETEERKHLESIYGKKAVSEILDPPKKKELTGLDKYLIFTFASLIVFTIAILVIFVITHEEPAVLVGCFFGAFASEVYHCAKIKKLKLHKEMELMNKNDNDTFT